MSKTRTLVKSNS